MSETGLVAIYNNGSEVQLTVGPRAQVETERRFGVQFEELFDPNSTNGRLEYLYFATWAALYYGGLDTTDDFDVWLTKIADVAPVQKSPSKSKPSPSAKPPSKASAKK